MFGEIPEDSENFRKAYKKFYKLREIRHKQLNQLGNNLVHMFLQWDTNVGGESELNVADITACVEEALECYEVERDKRIT